MQELLNASEVVQAVPSTNGLVAGLMNSPVSAVALAVCVILLAAWIWRSRRIQRRRLQHILTSYAERQLLQERPARVPSA